MLYLKSDDITLQAEESDHGRRLDQFLANRLAGDSRSAIKKLILQGHVHGPMGPLTRCAYKVQEGAIYCVHQALAQTHTLTPENIPLDIVYEDEDMLVINKTAGLVVHPAPGHRQGTLVNALLYHCSQLSQGSQEERPGIVHRLDQGTSGLMVVAKNNYAHGQLSQQFAARTLSRIYWAFVYGVTPPSARLENSIGRHPTHRKRMAVVAYRGKMACTHYHTKHIYGTVASLLECRLETGRTHQVRVHMAHHGHGIIADPTYGRTPPPIHPVQVFLRDRGWPCYRQALHAKRLQVLHPRTRQPMVFERDLPEDMQALKNFLETYQGSTPGKPCPKSST